MNRLRNWFDAQSLRSQWAVGCVGIVVIITSCLYGLGLISWIVRPTLVATPTPPATVVLTIPTVFRPTFTAPTSPPTLVLPGSTLVSTPTQAPIPTRAPTDTPTPTPLDFTPEVTPGTPAP